MAVENIGFGELAEEARQAHEDEQAVGGSPPVSSLTGTPEFEAWWRQGSGKTDMQKAIASDAWYQGRRAFWDEWDRMRFEVAALRLRLDKLEKGK